MEDLLRRCKLWMTAAVDRLRQMGADTCLHATRGLPELVSRLRPRSRGQPVVPSSAGSIGRCPTIDLELGSVGRSSVGAASPAAPDSGSGSNSGDSLSDAESRLRINAQLRADDSGHISSDSSGVGSDKERMSDGDSACASDNDTSDHRNCSESSSDPKDDLKMQLRRANDRISSLEMLLRQLAAANDSLNLQSDDQGQKIVDGSKVNFASTSDVHGGHSPSASVSSSSSISKHLPQRVLAKIPTTMTTAAAPPPPPPPLPPVGWTMKRKIKKRVPAPSCQLKTLNWIRLDEATLTGSVWTELNDERLYEILNLKELEKHFACTSNSDAYGTVRSRLSVCSTVREISVLDSRRAQNCAILLSKLKLTNQQIRKAVLTLDESDVFPKDMAEQLLKFLPTKEELEALSPYINAKDALHPADRFFLEVAEIERYEQRLRCLNFKKNFSDIVSDLCFKMTAITTASLRVVNSKQLRTLLEVVLAVGNYLNFSKRFSDAFGFHLTALTGMQDVKSSICCDYTLMHFVVEHSQKFVPDLFRLLQETAICVEASKISGNDLRQDLGRLRDGLMLFAKECESSDQEFVRIARPICQEFQRQFATTEEKFLQMEHSFVSCCKTFAPSENYAETLNTAEFFGYFAHFLVQFTTIEGQITRKKHEQEVRTLTLTRNQARKQEKAERNGSAFSGNSLDSSTKFRSSGRVSKKDVNEELLTSVLLAVERRKPSCMGSSYAKMRRSFRLSSKRKQLRTTSGLVVRRKLAPSKRPSLDDFSPETSSDCSSFDYQQRYNKTQSETFSRERVQPVVVA